MRLLFLFLLLSETFLLVADTPVSAQEPAPTPSENIEELDQRAQQLTKEHKYTEAITLYSKLVEMAPKDADYWLWLGILYQRTNNLTKAKLCLENCLELAPHYEDAHLALTRILHREGKLHEADEQLKIARSDNPNDPDVDLVEAQVKSELRQHKEAEKLYRKALREEPHLRTAFLSLIAEREYTDPSAKTGAVYSRERDKDPILKRYTSELDTFNSWVQLERPIGKNALLFGQYGWGFERLINLPSDTNLYDVGINTVSAKTNVFLNNKWTLNGGLQFKTGYNRSTSSYSFHNALEIEPSLTAKYATEKHLFATSWFVDSIVARDFSLMISHFIRRNNLFGLYEYRFQRPSTALGTQAQYLFYSDTVDNRELQCSLWGRLGVWNRNEENLLSLQYQLDFRRFDKVRLEYYSFEHQVTHFLRAIAHKRINNYFAIHAYCTHYWKFTTGIINSGVPIISNNPSLPQNLQNQFLNANDAQLMLQGQIASNLSAELSATYYWDPTVIVSTIRSSLLWRF